MLISMGIGWGEERSTARTGGETRWKKVSATRRDDTLLEVQAGLADGCSCFGNDL